jgi:1-acyl-sn-glycerol-3-phosphate acyltransferase
MRLNRIWHARVTGLGVVPLFLMKTILTVFGWFIRVEGAERLNDMSFPVIFAANHNNYLETLFLPCLLMYFTSRKVSFLVHWMFRDFPFIGWLMRFIDPVWVWSRPVRFSFGRRQKPKSVADAVTASVRRFRAGASVGIFPEGRRNHDPRVLLRGRRGLGEIVLRCGGTVVPLGIDFPARVKKGRIPVLGRMILRIGPPVDLRPEMTAWREAAENSGRDRFALRHKAVSLGRAITDKAMAAIAALCGKASVPERGRESPVIHHEAHEDHEGI